MIKVVVENGELPQKEIDAYVNMANKKHPNCKEMHITIVDNDFVDIDFHYDDIPFCRYRRITGYLVGDMDRWNDAKRAEEKDRVKHGSVDDGSI